MRPRARGLVESSVPSFTYLVTSFFLQTNAVPDFEMLLRDMGPGVTLCLRKVLVGK
jgi:hypothetical protein